MKKQIISLSMLMCLSPMLYAHTGHVEHHGFFATLWHVMTEADHLAAIILSSAAVLVVVAAVLKVRRNRKNAAMSREHMLSHR